MTGESKGEGQHFLAPQEVHAESGQGEPPQLQNCARALFVAHLVQPSHNLRPLDQHGFKVASMKTGKFFLFTRTPFLTIQYLLLVIRQVPKQSFSRLADEKFQSI